MSKNSKDKNKKFSQYDEIEEEVYKRKPKKVEKTEFELIEEVIIGSQNSEKQKNNEKWNRKKKNKKRDSWQDDDGWN